MSDEELGGNVIAFGPRATAAALRRPQRSLDPALADRVAALETQLIALEANLTRDRAVLDQLSESDAAPNTAAWGSSKSARDRDAERNARALLERTIFDRRALEEQVGRLRAERDALLAEIETIRGSVAAAPADAVSEPRGEETLDDVVGAMKDAVRGLIDDIRTAPAPAAPDPGPALYEDVEELPRTKTVAPPQESDVAAMWEAAAPSATPAAHEVEASPAAQAPAEAPAPIAAPLAPPPPVIDVLPPVVLERATFVTDEFIFQTSPLLRPRIVEPEAVVAPALPEAQPPAPALRERPVARQAILARPVAAPPAPEARPVQPPQPKPVAPAPHAMPAAAAPAQQAASRIQLVVSPIGSFARLIEIQRRLAELHGTSDLRLREYRNGVATFALSVDERISAHEFGAVVQMRGLGMRLLGATAMTAELRIEEEPATTSR